MPVEIRELHIKGTVSGSGEIEKKFKQFNSPLLQSELMAQLKKEIIDECTSKILDKLERKNQR